MLENRRERLQPADRGDRRASERIERVRVFNKQGRIVLLVGPERDRPHARQAGRVLLRLPRAGPAAREAAGARARAHLPPSPATASSGSSTRSRTSPRARPPPATRTAPSETVLGVLDVTVSLADVDRQIAASRNRIVGLAVGAVVVAGAAALVAQPAAGQPPGGGAHRGHAARRRRRPHDHHPGRPAATSSASWRARSTT